MKGQRTYFCIDMKSFYASVECAERGLNPFETKLVVADETRGNGTLCLAVSPKMKSLGVKNRCRVYEIPKGIDYIKAMPRMQKYIDYSADIYDIYLDFISPDDIHVYSCDEAFIDATNYLDMYHMEAKPFAKMLIDEIARRKHIPATAGIGTNLYLAKIALDITAKHVADHMGYLTEELYRETLWDHQPITDFWMVAGGTARRLSKHGIYTMRGVAECDPNLLYKTFGINAELLIDHAWGREPCTMADIKAYNSKSKSLSFSQILLEDYTYEKAKVVMTEMIHSASQEMMRRHVITNSISFFVGYSKDAIEPTGASTRMHETTSVFSIINGYIQPLFEKITNKTVPIRRLGLSFAVVDEGNEGYDLFTDFAQVEKEKQLEHSILAIQDKFGKNAMLRGFNYEKGATARERNKMIGGHKSGE
jgi:DNA polymerase V